MIYIIVNQLSLHMKGMMVLYVLGLTMIIICSQAISILVTDIYTLQSGVNLSDHLPLFFKLHINHSSFSSFLLLHRPNLCALTVSEIYC